jgi:hypothetical protein
LTNATETSATLNCDNASDYRTGNESLGVSLGIDEFSFAHRYEQQTTLHAWATVIFPGEEGRNVRLTHDADVEDDGG